MAYQATQWKNREVEKPRTFQMQQNADGTVTLVPSEGTIIEPGTPVNAGNMNHIEQGIKAVDDTVVAHLADNIHHVPYGVTTGTANTYAVSLDPVPTAYVEGMAVAVKINVNATAASTLNVNGLGAIAIKKSNGTDVTNLKANGIYTLRYDGTSFILQGEGGSGNATASDLLSGKTATTDAGEITGTMPNRGTVNITPGTTNQAIPAGYHSGGVVYGDPDLIAANILSGKNIFGVDGSLVQGKKWASGQVFVNTVPVTVTGLDFNPNVVKMTRNDSTTGRVGFLSKHPVKGTLVMGYLGVDGSNYLSSPPTQPSNGFSMSQLPDYPGSSGANYTWIAYE